MVDKLFNQHTQSNRLFCLCLLALILLFTRLVWLPAYYKAINNQKQSYQLRQLLNQQNDKTNIALAETHNQIGNVAKEMEYIADAYYHADSFTSAESQLLATLQFCANNSEFNITNASLLTDQSTSTSTFMNYVVINIRGEGTRQSYLRFLHQLSQSRPAHVIKYMQLNISNDVTNIAAHFRIAAIWQSPALDIPITKLASVTPILSWDAFSRMSLLGSGPKQDNIVNSTPFEIPKDLKLVGIIWGSPRNVAIFKLGNGEQCSAITGDIIAGVQIREIYNDRVELQIGTNITIMYID